MKEENIISYNPDLNIYGKTNSFIKGNGAITAPSQYIKTKTSLNTDKSKNLINFIYYSPYEAVKAIDNLINLLNKKISEMTKNLSNQYESQYFSSNDDEEKNKILKANQNDMDYGSTMLEAFSQLQNIKKDLSEILNIYMQCVFGTDIDTSEVKEIVDSYISQIEGYESKEEFTKVNYIGLYYDTKISYILSDFIGQLDAICQELLGISDDSISTNIDSKTYKLINNYFEKQNKELMANLYNVKKCGKVLCTALKNIYIKRQTLRDNLELFSNIYNSDFDKELLYDIEDDCYKDVDNAVMDFIKTCMNYNMCYGDVSNTLKNKTKYRKFI